ncbi:hypothetical protein AgCh_036051 [Apium graveolens]
MELPQDELARGDVPKSIQCHTGTTEEVAQTEMRALMRKKWREINVCQVRDMPLPRSFVAIMLNAGRSAHYIYCNSDGFAGQDGRNKDNKLFQLTVQPIPM